jgi:diguanylate cyclase (GGDEF)-like protein
MSSEPKSVELDDSSQAVQPEEKKPDLMRGTKETNRNDISDEKIAEMSGQILPFLVAFQEKELTVQETSRAIARTLAHNDELAKEVAKIALEDGLTRLHNRRSFDIDFENKLHEDKPFGFLIFDVDHFKEVNDELGHKVGDLALKHISELLGISIRDLGSEEDVGYRYGGDEITVILDGISSNDQLGVTAERIRSIIEKVPLIYEGAFQKKLTISMGGKIFIPGVSSPEKFLEEADKALYKAKEAGRNRIEISADDRNKNV